ncbi:acyl carrier protein [Actinoplanes sp. NPDC049316]|uniref:acyl carrier protein n=1 Tax=Actinoplanes sp. NPDC049316 TaxID=3154727 RepID=UPI00343AA7FD
MTDTSQTTTETAETVRAWLVDRVAFYLERPAADIDVSAPLVDLGLDSVYALTLCGDVEDRFGVVVEATMAWDHPTVNAMTDHLTGLVSGDR